MNASVAPMPQMLDLRRRWPSVMFGFGLASAIGAYGLIMVLSDRIVRLGRIDAAVVAAMLATVAIWCFAVFLIGLTAGVARGRVASFLHLAVLVPLIGLVALAMTGFVNFAVLIAVREDPQVQLEVPDGSPQYIVVPLTFGETSLTLYRGNGFVYDRVDVQLPYLDRSSLFADAYRIEKSPDRGLRLRYPRDGGGEANVPLP